MRDRIRSANWSFEYDQTRVKLPLRDVILEWIESRSGIRIGEYKNYKLI
jgi:hypothetical protein